MSAVQIIVAVADEGVWDGRLGVSGIWGIIYYCSNMLHLRVLDRLG